MNFDEFIAELERPLPFHRKTYYSALRNIRKPRQGLREVKWGWQRARRGYSDADSWSLHYHLACVTLGGVRGLRERDFGWPAHMTHEEWLQTLDEMIVGFQAIVDDDRDSKEAQRALTLLHEHFFSLWD